MIYLSGQIRLVDVWSSVTRLTSIAMANTKPTPANYLLTLPSMLFPLETCVKIILLPITSFFPQLSSLVFPLPLPHYFP